MINFFYLFLFGQDPLFLRNSICTLSRGPWTIKSVKSVKLIIFFFCEFKRDLSYMTQNDEISALNTAVSTYKNCLWLSYDSFVHLEVHVLMKCQNWCNFVLTSLSISKVSRFFKSVFNDKLKGTLTFFSDLVFRYNYNFISYYCFSE